MVTKREFLSKILKKYINYYLLSGLLMLISTFFISIMPQIINLVFDKAVSENNFNLLIKYIFAYIILVIVYNYCDMINGNLFTKTGAKVVNDIRESLCISVSRKNGTYYTNLKSGDIANRILSEVEFIESFITQNLFTIITDLLSVLAISVVLFKINSIMMLIILLIQPITIIIQSKFGKKSRSLTMKFRISYQNMCAATSEFLTSVMNIIFAGGIDSFIKKYKSLQETVIVDVVESQSNGNRSYFYQDVLSNIILIFIIGYGGYTVMQGNMTLGQLVVFNMYSSRIFNSINRLSKSYIRFKQFDVYLDRIVEVINKDNINSSNIPFIFNNKIQFLNVTFSYNDKIILQDINMEIQKGDKIAIVGESGVGKSTIINLLYSLWRCNSGKLLIDDVTIDEINIEDLRKHIGVVSQNTFFFNDTIYNNLVLDRKISYSEVEDACKAACIHEFIMTLPDKYNTVIQENGKNLSGGQKQRLSIARVLLSEPEIYIFDEPTSAVDNILGSQVENNIFSFIANKTVITITHKLDSIKKYDVIYVLKDGNVSEFGNFDYLLNKKEVFYEMYKNYL